MWDNKTRHLFIFEGARAEKIIFDKLEQNFFGKKHSIKCVYDAEVYQLYKQLSSDDFALDIVNLLKERSPRLPKNSKITIATALPLYICFLITTDIHLLRMTVK